MAQRPPASPVQDRFLLGIVLGAVALILAGVVAVVLVGRRAPTPPADPTVPVGVVQAYVEALRAGNYDQAYGYLSRSARASTTLERWRQNAPRYPDASRNDTRVLIEPITVGSDTAEVKVTISRFSARTDPFSTSTYHRDVTVRLVREDDAWRIDAPVEPYSLLY